MPDAQNSVQNIGSQQHQPANNNIAQSANSQMPPPPPPPPPSSLLPPSSSLLSTSSSSHLNQTIAPSPSQNQPGYWDSSMYWNQSAPMSNPMYGMSNPSFDLNYRDDMNKKLEN